MSTQRYAVEFGRKVVGVAFRVPGGFMFVSSDPRFDEIDGSLFPRARALARRLTEMCDADQLAVRRQTPSEGIPAPHYGRISTASGQTSKSTDTRS